MKNDYIILSSHDGMMYKKGDVVVLNNGFIFMGEDLGGKTTTISGIRDWGWVGLDYAVSISRELCLIDENIDHVATFQLRDKISKNKTIQLTPRYNDKYFYVDLADPNLFGVATWLNDDTDFHMLKLGLIKDTAQECVKMAKDMLKKLGLEV